MRNYYLGKMSKASVNVLFVVLILLIFTTTKISATIAYSDTEHWAKNYINYVTDQGYFKGTSNTTFSPEDNMTRGMFVTILARYSKADISQYSIFNTSFEDVNVDKYYSNAIAWVYANNIISGKSEAIFCPEGYITREEAAVILEKYFSIYKSIPMTICDDGNYFNDIDQASSWACSAVKVMKITNTFSGDENGNFRPLNNITRAECAVVLSRMDKKTFNNYKIPAPVINYLSGKASAYSENLIGGPTASGERLSSTAYTVAVPISEYKTYAGRHVEIVYENVKIVARCNDCGGFAKYGRVLDLSPGCFKAFGFSSSNSWGVRTVQYRWID